MSDELIIDLSNYKDRVGSRVAPDRYRVVVEDAEPTESAAKNPMINLWFRIVGGEFDGQTVTDRLVLTEKSLFRVVGFMQAIGLPTPKKRLKLNIRQFVGRTLEIDVEDGEPYNGRVRSEVRGYIKVPRAAGEAAVEDLDEFGSETDASATDLPEVETPQETAPASAPTGSEIGNRSGSEIGQTSSAAVVDDDGAVDLDSIEIN